MKYKIGLCQMAGTDQKEESRAIASKFVAEAAESGAEVVVLPEMWNCPYANEYFRPYAEPESGETVSFMSELAKSHGVYLVGGSIPEVEDEKVYNTSFIFDPSGKRIGRHRKTHLCDIDVKGGIRVMESDTLSPGDEITVVETKFGPIGVGICYDVRFPELTRKMALQGAKLVILPAAFNTTTGPVHWTLTMQARALDNQLYFAACSPARVEGGVYEAYGHSLVADPWGAVMEELDTKPRILMAEIDTDYADEIRQQLPLLKHRREELY